MAENVFSVKEIVGYIENKLKSDGLLSGIGIMGEVSNFGKNGRGTLFFSLAQEDSLLDCISFDGINEELKNGDSIHAFGDLRFFKRSGRVYLILKKVEKEGIGKKARELEEFKNSLEKSGAFDSARKRTLPAFPKKIGLVTSGTGAVLQDILTVSRRRFDGINFLIWDAKVQGEGAAEDISRGISKLGPMVDVVIVARGGGSAVDLEAFNTKEVVYGVLACPSPVVSAVGHETDVTLCDLVADIRAATPSMAAEITLPLMEDVLSHIDGVERSLALLAKGRLDSCCGAYELGKERLKRLSPSHRYEKIELVAEELKLRLTNAAKARVLRCQGQIDSLNATLFALDIHGILKRGFAYVKRQGETAKDLEEMAVGDKLILTMKDRELLVQIEEISMNKGHSV